MKLIPTLALGLMVAVAATDASAAPVNHAGRRNGAIAGAVGGAVVGGPVGLVVGGVGGAIIGGHARRHHVRRVRHVVRHR